MRCEVGRERRRRGSKHTQRRGTREWRRGTRDPGLGSPWAWHGSSVMSSWKFMYLSPPVLFSHSSSSVPRASRRPLPTHENDLVLPLTKKRATNRHRYRFMPCRTPPASPSTRAASRPHCSWRPRRAIPGSYRSCATTPGPWDSRPSSPCRPPSRSPCT